MIRCVQFELVLSRPDPVPPWPGEEFTFELDVALWPIQPQGRRSYCSAGEPEEPGGWELRRAACTEIVGPAGRVESFTSHGSEVCSAWLWAERESPGIERAISGALAEHLAARW